MPRSDPLTQRVVTSVTQHAHLIQRLDAVREGEREPVRDDHPIAAEPNRPCPRPLTAPVHHKH
jgi:uncharacterized protein (DUF2249 family)